MKHNDISGNNSGTNGAANGTGSSRLLHYILNLASGVDASTGVSYTSLDPGNDGAWVSQLLMGYLTDPIVTGSGSSNSITKDLFDSLADMLKSLEIDSPHTPSPDPDPNPDPNPNPTPSAVTLFNSYLEHLNQLLLKKQYEKFKQMKQWTNYHGNMEDLCR